MIDMRGNEIDIYNSIKQERPNMNAIVKDIAVFDRPSANDSKEMFDYILMLEYFIENKVFG